MADFFEIMGKILDLERDNEDVDSYDEAQENFSVYIIQEIKDSIGTNEFKYTFENLFDDLVSLDLKKQIQFCREVIQRITEVYQLVFFEEMYILDEQDVSSFYDFLKYIEYECIDFINYIWDNVGNGINFPLDLDDYYLSVQKKVFEIIFEYKTEKNSEILINLLRTNTRNSVIRFLTIKTRQFYDEILIYQKLKR